MKPEHRNKKAGLSDTLRALQKGSREDRGMYDLIETLANAINEALLITDDQFIILFINNGMRQHLGFRGAELNGKHLSEIFSKSQWALFEVACMSYASQASESLSQFSQVTSIITKQGMELSTVVSLDYLCVENNNIYVFLFGGIKRHTGDRLIAQQKRQQQLRLQAVGRLTAGLAHEYNNLLTSIVGYSDILSMRLSQDDKLSRYVDHISRASNRAADLTRHVMAFSRHHSVQPEICDLNVIVSDMEKMIRGLFEEGVEIDFQLNSYPALVWVDLGVLLHILIIVLLSVRQGLARNSQVIIAIKKHPLSDSPAKSSDENPGEFINLAVTCMTKTTPPDVDQNADTAPLELHELREDLEGVFNLAQQVGGEIHVVRESASTITYNIYLPVTPQSLENLTTEDIPLDSTPGIETILVVDDEDMIRALIRETLQMDGYHVLEASRPTEALNISRQYQRSIHLLVSDVVMPDMNGRELADQLVAERPHLRLLFISGHSHHLLTRTGVDSMEDCFLQKPFSTSALIEKVRLALTHPLPYSIPSKSLDQT